MKEKKKHAGFKTEKEFVKYLCLNIDKWVKDFFDEEADKILINQGLHFRRFGANVPQIDLTIQTKSGKKIGIECKNPKQPFHETSRAISQLLSYGIIAEEAGKPFDILALITSDKHNIGCKIVKKYNLPIRIFYVDKKIHGELK